MTKLAALFARIRAALSSYSQSGSVSRGRPLRYQYGAAASPLTSRAIRLRRVVCSSPARGVGPTRMAARVAGRPRSPGPSGGEMLSDFRAALTPGWASAQVAPNELRRRRLRISILARPR